MLERGRSLQGLQATSSCEAPAVEFTGTSGYRGTRSIDDVTLPGKSDGTRQHMRQGTSVRTMSYPLPPRAAIRRKVPALPRRSGARILAWPLLRLMSVLLVCCAGAAQSRTSAAETYVAEPQDYLELLKLLRPGDRLILKAGIYKGGLPLHSITGSPDAPIIIEGAPDGQPAVLRARPGANTVSMANSSHLVVSNLVLDGGGLPVDAIVTERRSAPVHHITLERLTIVGHGHDQSIVGIGTRCPTAFWTIRDNIIIGAGTGMYLGSSDGSAPFVAGLIENNRILDTIGYNIQIKHQNPRPDLVELPQTRQSTLIQGNFFSKSSNASEGQMARPNLLVGHLPVVGAGSQDRYEVVHNVFYFNPVEVLLQGEGNLLISDNIFVNPMGSAIAIRPHHDVPRQVDIKRNFIAAASAGVSVTGGHPGYRQLVESNSVYAKEPLMGGSRRQNVTGPYAELGRDFRQWLARERTARANAQPDWQRTLKEMADTVCAGSDARASNSDWSPSANGGIARSCSFLQDIARLAASQRDE